jgi:hypothetical protein
MLTLGQMLFKLFRLTFSAVLFSDIQGNVSSHPWLMSQLLSVWVSKSLKHFRPICIYPDMNSWPFGCSWVEMLLGHLAVFH